MMIPHPDDEPAVIEVLEAFEMEADPESDSKALTISPSTNPLLRRAADRRMGHIRELTNDDALYQIAVTLLRGTGTDASRLRYAEDIRIFLTWTSSQGHDPRSMTRDDLIDYLDSIKHYKVASQKRLATVTRLLFRELEVRDLLAGHNPAIMLPKIRGKSDEQPAGYTEEEARRLLVGITERFDCDKQLPSDASPEEWQRARAQAYTARRDYAIVFLALTSGLRASELVGLRVEDIRRERSIYWVIQVRGKGRKERLVKIQPETVEVIEEYKNAMKDLGVDLVDGDPLFIRVNWDAEPDGAHAMGTRNLRHLVTKWAGASALGGAGKAVHQLRRTAATIAYDNGGTLEEIADFLGHADPRTARDLYIKPIDRLRKSASDRIPDLRAPTN